MLRTEMTTIREQWQKRKEIKKKTIKDVCKLLIIRYKFLFQKFCYNLKDIERLMRTAREANPNMTEEEIKAAIKNNK